MFKSMAIFLAFLLLAGTSAAMSCAYTNTPSLNTKMFLACETALPANATCFSITSHTVTGSFVDWWPGDTTYNGTGAAFTLGDGSIIFPVDVSMQYFEGVNYTWNATCSLGNGTKESAIGTFVPASPQAPAWMGSWMIWAKNQMAYLLAGGVAMIFIVGGLFLLRTSL